MNPPALILFQGQRNREDVIKQELDAGDMGSIPGTADLQCALPLWASGVPAVEGEDWREHLLPCYSGCDQWKALKPRAVIS